ncbi:hypothetical protein [Streptomyces sp. NPDC053427]|uniref:hypothetical protein n=1 Tax=Streptomyces sp. NPDC053427 TaxID=3365701 RepID=UPI0037D91664
MDPTGRSTLGGGPEAQIDVETYANDRKTVEEFEATAAPYEEAAEFRRMCGRPDYFLRFAVAVAVADHAAYETFLMPPRPPRHHPAHPHLRPTTS